MDIHTLQALQNYFQKELVRRFGGGSVEPAYQNPEAGELIRFIELLQFLIDSEDRTMSAYYGEGVKR